MTVLIQTLRARAPSGRHALLTGDRVVLAVLAVLAGLAVVEPSRAVRTATVVAGALLNIAPLLAFAMLVAAWAQATGATALLA